MVKQAFRSGDAGRRRVSSEVGRRLQHRQPRDEARNRARDAVGRHDVKHHVAAQVVGRPSSDGWDSTMRTLVGAPIFRSLRPTQPTARPLRGLAPASPARRRSGWVRTSTGSTLWLGLIIGRRLPRNFSVTTRPVFAGGRPSSNPSRDFDRVFPCIAYGRFLADRTVLLRSPALSFEGSAACVRRPFKMGGRYTPRARISCR